MKKRFLLLLIPLLMAFQCENDPYFGTEYYILNNSSFDLTLFTEEAGEILIESQSDQYIAKNSSSSSFVLPSENYAFNEIKLYREDNNGNLFLTYKQEPILNNLWIPDPDPSDPDLFYYKLLITDELLE